MPLLTTAQVQAALDEALTAAENAATSPLVKYVLLGLKTALDSTSLASYLTTAINAVLAKLPA